MVLEVVLVDVGEVVVVVLVLVGDVVVLVEVEVGDVVVVAVVDVDEVVTFGGQTISTSLDDHRSPADPSDATPYQRVAPGTGVGANVVVNPRSR